MGMSMGPLAETEWQAARALAHRAFIDEPFTVEMYGESIMDRWGGSWALYASLARTPSTFALGARAGDVLIGFVLANAPGHCAICEVIAREPRPDDPHLAVDWQFHQNVAHAHRQLDKHAYIDKLVVEPALHGLGIGRRLLDAAVAAVTGDGPNDVVLVCAPDRHDPRRHRRAGQVHDPWHGSEGDLTALAPTTTLRQARRSTGR